jgi:hypothetical protein
MPKAGFRVIGDVRLYVTPLAIGGFVEFVLFEDVHGKEVYVNPKRVIWVREYGDQNTEISCGAEDKFTVRLSPAQAVAALGIKVR